MGGTAFYSLGGKVWFLKDASTLERGSFITNDQETLRIDHWDDGMPKVGSEYGVPVDPRSRAQPSEVAGAKKYDGDKPMMDLLMDGCPQALLAVGEVLTYGFKKYGGKHGWKHLPDAKTRYEAAMVRHQLALASGEINDPESGLPHAAHIACNALFLLQFHKENKTCN